MPLARDSWVHYTEGMPLGRKARVQHECGPGRTLVVSRDDEGFRAWCFRCNDGDRAPPPAESLADKVRRLEQQRHADSGLRINGVMLPVPATAAVDQWPPAARLWLYKAGLGRAEIGRLGAYYHAPSDRVVLPVYEGDGPVFWQARAVDGRQPKYMAPEVDRSHVLPRYGNPRARPTLTEDILSAYKVGMAGSWGWSLLGTRASPRVVTELLRVGRGCNVWLDADKAGRSAASKIGKQLRAYGIEVTDICTPKDPKLQHTATIQELLHVT